ncbi:MAG: hypothetical protein AAF997_06780 [Myxococcota bacterium]
MRTTIALALLTIIACGSDDGGGQVEGVGSEAPCERACDGAREVCERVEDDEACVCAAGYSGEPCEWGTVPADPSFNATEAWTAEAGVTVLPAAEGVDSGVAQIDGFGLCNGAMIGTTVDMPGADTGDQFVAEIRFRSIVTGGMVIYAGRARHPVQSVGTASWLTERVCLGTAAFGSAGRTRGGPVEFRIGVSRVPPDCDPESARSVEIDRFQILVAEPGECPTVGTVANGNAEPEGGGWQFLLDAADGGAGAELADEIGRDGTGGARIYKDQPQTPGFAKMGTRISVPLPNAAGAGPALRFWWRQTGFTAFANLGWTAPLAIEVSAALSTLGRFDESREGVASYCLPPWTHGAVVPLWFQPATDGFEGELVVDEVEITLDPRCGDSADLLDPGLDSAPNLWPGSHWQGLLEVDPGVEIVTGRGRGEPPGGALLFRYDSGNPRLLFRSMVWVPEGSGERGPQLVFYSNVVLPAPEGTGIRTDVAINRTAIGENLPVGVGWSRNTYCLPSGWSGRWLPFQIVLENREVGTFDLVEPTRELLFDDFELTTSTACAN